MGEDRARAGDEEEKERDVKSFVGIMTWRLIEAESLSANFLKLPALSGGKHFASYAVYSIVLMGGCGKIFVKFV